MERIFPDFHFEYIEQNRRFDTADTNAAAYLTVAENLSLTELAHVSRTFGEVLAQSPETCYKFGSTLHTQKAVML
jgi:hypothetical protein